MATKGSSPQGKGDQAPKLSAADEKALDAAWAKVGSKGGNSKPSSGTTKKGK